jgi:chitodextrinase
VAFKLAGDTLCAAELDSHGKVSCSADGSVPPGTHTVSAHYAGDAHHDPAVTTLSLTVAKAPSSITVSDATAVHGTGGSLPVDVDSTGSVPTGTVRLLDGSTSLDSATLSHGHATLQVPAELAQGSHQLTVSYSGDDTSAATSAEVTVTVLPPAWAAKSGYAAGAQVSYGGGVWQALWWTQNQEPGDPNGPWELMASAPDGTALWTASRVFDSGDVVSYQGEKYRAKWWTRNQAPGDQYGPWQPLG